MAIRLNHRCRAPVTSEIGVQSRKDFDVALFDKSDSHSGPGRAGRTKTIFKFPSLFMQIGRGPADKIMRFLPIYMRSVVVKREETF